MKVFKYISILATLTILLSSCNLKRDCPPNAIIEWIDLVMINDIKYEHHFPEPTDENVPLTVEKGNELGTVTYQMADRACSNHKMKNGDAAYLQEGTPIYEIKGYPSSLVVLANDKVYVADENKKAMTARELYAMDGLVKNIYIESTVDGSRLHAFSQSSKDKFLAAWNQLKLEDVESLTRSKKLEENRVFLEIELNNGIAFRMLYWPDSNIFQSGVIGNEEIKEIINHELSNLE